jgi:hypothetical protein
MILLAALALSQVDPIALGRARADFGQIPNSGRWKFVFTSQFGGTTILFPAGRADIRYYCVQLNGAGYRLCRQSKRAGKIRRDWIFETTIRNTNPVRSSRDGVLRAYLSDFLLPKGLSKETLEDLDSSSSFASYRPQSGGSPKFDYHRRGEILFLTKEIDSAKQLPGWEIPANEMKLIPRTTKPYPITPEELEEIKKGIAPAKN